MMARVVDANAEKARDTPKKPINDKAIATTGVCVCVCNANESRTTMEWEKKAGKVARARAKKLTWE